MNHYNKMDEKIIEKISGFSFYKNWTFFFKYCNIQNWISSKLDLPKAGHDYDY